MERFYNTNLYEPLPWGGNDPPSDPAHTTDTSKCKTKLDSYFRMMVFFQLRVQEVRTAEVPLSSPEAGRDRSLFNWARGGTRDAAG